MNQRQSRYFWILALVLCDVCIVIYLNFSLSITFPSQNAGANDAIEYQNKIMINIAHVINPFECVKNHPTYLREAQLITFASIINAKREALKHDIKVHIYTINFPEDDAFISKHIKKEFIPLPYLTRSLKSAHKQLLQKYVWDNPDNKDNFTLSNPPPVPMVGDIIQALYNYSNQLQNDHGTNMEYLMFSNVDIGLQRNFYVDVYNKLSQNNSDKREQRALIINRRTIPKAINNHYLTYKDLNIIYELGQSEKLSDRHPGFDCFIWDKRITPNINLADLFLGYGPWGNVFQRVLRRLSNKGNVLRDEFLTFHIGNDHGGRKRLDATNLLRLNRIIANST